MREETVQYNMTHIIDARLHLFNHASQIVWDLPDFRPLEVVRQLSNIVPVADAS